MSATQIPLTLIPNVTEEVPVLTANALIVDAIVIQNQLTLIANVLQAIHV